MYRVMLKPAVLAPTLTRHLSLIRRAGLDPHLMLEQCIMTYDYDFYIYSLECTDAMFEFLQEHDGLIPEFNNSGVMTQVVYPTIAELHSALSGIVKNTNVSNVRWITKEDVEVYFEQTQ